MSAVTFPEALAIASREIVLYVGRQVPGAGLINEYSVKDILRLNFSQFVDGGASGGGDIPAQVPSLPGGVSRQDAIEGLRELYRMAVAAERLLDKTFVGWPTMAALLDHIEAHGLGAKAEEVSHEGTKGTEEEGK